MSKHTLLHLPHRNDFNLHFNFFFSKEKRSFCQTSTILQTFQWARRIFFFFGEPWNLKSYRPGDFRESGPYSRTERYLGHFLFIKKLNPAVKILAI